MPHHAAYGIALGELDIAVIEDNEATALAMCAMVAEFGVARIRPFRNDGAVLAELIESPPHVVMVECGEGERDGRLDVRAIRACAPAPLSLAAVIAMSARASESLVRAAFLAGANQFLAKPAAPTTVLGRLVWLQRDSRELVRDGERYVADGAVAEPGRGDALPALAMRVGD